MMCVAFYLGLRFALEALRFVSEDLAFCVQKILCFVFRRSCVLSSKDFAFCLQKILRFVSEDLAFCLQKVLRFVFRRTCVLSSEDLAFYLQRSCVLPQKHCVLKEAIYLILTGIGDEVYSTVDACQTTQEMWEAIERLQQEVNELRAERLASNANPLALVATAQANQDPYYQTSKSHKSYASSSKLSIPTRSHTTTRHKGKEIAKSITPPSEIASEEDSDPIQAQRDKDIQNNLALIAKYFKKIYKPTNNNLRTSSNSRNKNVDTTSRYKNDNHSGQFRNQRTVNVVGARKNVGSPIVQQSGIQCFNCKEFRHFSKESRKPKRVKDSTYHKEKMLLCKKATWQRFRRFLQLTQAPILSQWNEARYNVFANDLQHSKQSESVSNTCLVEMDDSNVIPDSPDTCNDDIQNDQNDVESDDEHVALANLIANLKLDVDENKKIQKQIKKANTTLSQELKECKTIFAKTSNALGSLLVFGIVTWLHFRTSRLSLRSMRHLMTVQLTVTNFNQEMHADLKYVESLEKEIDEIESDKAEFSNISERKSIKCLSKKHEQYIKIQDLKAQLQEKNIAISELKKLIKKGKGKSVETKFDKPSVVRQPNAQRFPKPSVLGKPTPFSNSLERIYFSKTKSVPKTNVSEGLSKPVTAHTLPQTARQAVSNTNVLRPGMYQLNNSTTQARAPQLP
uniref:Uncharacterized protein n=1 Tax=Tanacetum cinerariifolium TaxID=118510 RepID=A0A699HTN4_TANCI|nr:hypothetical protein [Tanacetum cinerariifolium]